MNISTPDELPEPPENALIARIKVTKIEPFEYSAIIDDETCSVCKAADGITAADPKALPPAPNPKCTNRDMCRCMIVEIFV